MTDIVNSIAECMLLQDSFNKVVNPNWKTANYAFRRAMWVEAGELCDHLGYKWWKNIDAPWDQKQALLEVVDMFHFLLSECIIAGKTPKSIANCYVWATKHTYAPTKEKKLKQIEEFVAACLEDSSVEPGFFQVMVALNVDIDDLLKYYLGKNALNKLRQDNGYKAGAYHKEWMFQGNLVEDNVVLENVLEASGVVSFDTVYNELDTLYKQMNMQQ